MREIENLLEEALEAARKVERTAIKSFDYIQIAGIYLSRGQKTRCLEVLAETLKIVDSLKQPDEKAVCLAQTAAIFTRAGELD